MSISDLFRTGLKKIVYDTFKFEMNDNDLIVEKPPEGKAGQFGSNIAFIVSKITKKNPVEIADSIAKKMKDDILFSNVTVIRPGYINWDLNDDFYKQELIKIIRKEDYFVNKAVKEENINIEFVSANPVGPLNVVSGRAAAYGDVMANLLAYNGHKITREFYVNDHGNQLKSFAVSLKERYLELNKIKEKADIPEDGYKGEYITDIARNIASQSPDVKQDVLNLLKDGKEDDLTMFFRHLGLNYIRTWQENTLKNFGIRFDVWFSENSLYEKNYVEKILNKLKEKDDRLIYEKDGAWWFKTTIFGDDKDRVIKKSDGELTYFASDIAYMQSKIDRGADKIVMVLGPDHHGYVKRIEAIIQALGYEKDRLKIIILQQVNLIEGGEKKKMSKREGKFVLLDELLDSVGVDAARYYFLMRNYNSHLDFDIEMAKEQSEKNPVYYVQYAYARICNILLFAKEKNVDFDKVDVEKDIDFGNLEKEEKDLITAILQTPDVFKISMEKYSPSFVVNNLYGIASVFHSFYNKYRVVTEDKNSTLKRLLIVHALKATFLNYFKILGITAKERM
ncbi:MAG: arginine--tRNA ligase [Candidatus Goldbacteria bacterium]|nr:arginine--tRNA ligase [Candidatus Goldiibacteriota bacterium]